MAEFIRVDMNDVWAAGGDSVPPTKAKIAEGWLVEAVPRQWWNWMQNRVDSNVAYLLQKGLPEWDSDTEYFANKSIQQYRGVVYKALKDSKGVDPTSAGQTSWAVAFTDSTPYLEKIKNIAVTPGTIPLIDAGGNAGAWNYGQTGLSVLSAPTPADARNIIGAQVGHPNLTALSSVAGGTNVLPYFNGNSTMAGTPLTTFGRDFISRTDPTSGRAALGLGTAAIYNAQPVAWSTGTLMFSGAFGLGGYSIISSTANVNVNDPNCPSGFYDVSPDSIPGFVSPLPGWTRIIHQCHANSAGFATQIATGDFANAGSARIFVRKAATTGWGAWVELMNSTTFPTQAHQMDGAAAGIGAGKLLRVGAFGLGSGLDLRATGYDIAPPSSIIKVGTVSGFTQASYIGLDTQVSGIGGGAYVGLQINAPADPSAYQSYMRIATFQERIFIQGVFSGSAWGSWREVYTTANTTALTTSVTASVTANIQPTLNAKLDTAKYGVTQGDQFQDPNLVNSAVVLSNHPNCPDPATYWHITTTFYAALGSTANRGQVAVEYNPSGQARSFIRSSYDGVWKPWVRIDNNGTAGTATRLATARTISCYGELAVL